MIDEQAIVSPEADIGAGVEVGPYAVVGPQVSIGPGSTIGPHAVIKGPTTIGRDNRIYQFASVGDDPQDKKYAGEPTRLEIGNGNTIREFCTINRGTVQDRGVTTIGDDNWIMAYVHVAHDCEIGDGTVLANCVTLAGHVSVGDFAVLGGFSGVHQFCRIGSHCLLGMFSGVTRDVPNYVTVSGHPAEPHGINAEGLKRRGFTPGQIRNIRHAYRLLYREGLKLQEARERLGELARSQPEIAPLAEFLGSSRRSIVR
ncbi:MAG: acyl-ACP--UDP-N-acetylglucosamine O-acyltransferase [Gammaproteobacteria bacterium]